MGKKQRKAAQAQAKAAAEKAKKNQVPIIPLATAAVAVIAGIAFLPGLFRGGGPIDGVQTISGVERGHSQGPYTWTQHPPAGGVHHPAWQNCGIYNTQIPIEHAVHSLEHGAVWIAYRPDLAQPEVDQLKSLVRGRPYMLLAPYQYGQLNAPVVAVAWGTRLEAQAANDPRLPRFIQKYVQGSQTPEPGASCSGAFGSPSE